MSDFQYKNSITLWTHKSALLAQSGQYILLLQKNKTHLHLFNLHCVLLSHWHRCPLVKIFSKIYQGVQRTASTETMSWCRLSNHCFQTSALWSTYDYLFSQQNGPNLNWTLFAQCVSKLRELKAFIIPSNPGAWSQTCFGAIQKCWHPDPATEKDHKWFISQGSSVVIEESSIGESWEFVPEIEWEVLN